MVRRLHVVSHSETGLVRKNNQDSGYASPRLLVVADGMGGAAAGDLASAVAVDTLMRVDDAARGPAMLEVMGTAVAVANDRIADLVESDVALDGMGTTVTAALFDGNELGLVHIGDSRAYLLRGGTLARLTHDHSWVQSLVDEGRISEEEAAVHPHRSLLLRVLNGQAGSEPELARVPLEDGDRLMFCSDGLCGLVDDPEIARLLARTEPDDALDGLVAAARHEGGIDNITVIVADVVPAPEAVAVADEAGNGEAGAGEAGTGAPAAAGTVLGAAAERAIPDLPGRGPRVEATEDTVVTPRLRAVGRADTPDAAAAVPVAAGAGTAGAATATVAAASAGPRPSDEERYDPQAPHRRRFLRPLVGLLVAALVAAAGLGTAYAWTRTQYYVGASGEHVAIYQGLSEGLPGLPLSTLYEVQPLTVAQLPPYYQEKVRGAIDVASLGAARDTVTELREAVQRCSGTVPTPTVGPSVTTSSTSRPATPSASPPSTTRPAATSSPRSSPSPAGGSASPTGSAGPGTGC